MTEVHRAETYLAEWYVPDLAESVVDDMVARLDAAALAVTGEGTPVRLAMTLSVPADEVLYGIFDAGSSEAVANACQRAGIPHQRLSSPVVARLGRACRDEQARRDARDKL